MKVPCEHCNGSGVRDQPYYNIYGDGLYEQTPKQVWRDYLDAGYTMVQALAEERSYV